jgi:hypothetical protein
VPKINFFIQNIHFAAKFASTLTLLSGAAAALASPPLSCTPEGLRLKKTLYPVGLSTLKQN